MGSSSVSIEIAAEAVSFEADPDNLKLITLARAARARLGAAEGAAVRDETGRTYAAPNIDLPHLRLGALELAVANAVAAGAIGLEAAAQVSEETALSASALTVAGDIGSQPWSLARCSAAGVVQEVIQIGVPG